MKNFKKTDSEGQSYNISQTNNSLSPKTSFNKCQIDEKNEDNLHVQSKENASSQFSQLERDNSDKMCDKEAKSEIKELFHITMPYAGYFSHLEVMKKENVDLKKQDSYKEYLYFEKKEEAEKLLWYIKQSIFNFYKLREDVEGISCPDWVNECWVESANWEEYEKS